MQLNNHGFVYVLILIRLPIVLAVAITGFLLTVQLTSCDECRFGVAEYNEWCHMAIVPRSIGGEKLEYKVYESNWEATVSVSGNGVNTGGTPLKSDECQLVVESTPQNSWVVSDASTESPQLTLLEIKDLNPMAAPHCKDMGADVPKEKRAFQTEDLPSGLMIISLIVWLLIKVCGWYVEKNKWHQTQGMTADDQKAQAQQEGWLGKVFSFTGYIIFTLAPNQILLPLTTITLHESCPQLLTMSYESSVWTQALAYEALVVAITAVYFVGIFVILTCGVGTDSSSMTGFSSGGGCFMCGMCLLLYGGALAIVACGVYFVGAYVVKYAANVSPAVILGIDLRYLFTFRWPDVSIALQGSVLRICLFLVMVLDFIAFVLKYLKKGVVKTSSGTARSEPNTIGEISRA